MNLSVVFVFGKVLRFEFLEIALMTAVRFVCPIC